MGATRSPMSRWEALGILMVLAFLNYMDRNLVFPLLDLIARDLHLEPDQLGALATGFHLVYAFAAPAVGYLSDRMPRKVILLVALVTWSLVTALSGTATGFLSLLLFRSLTGLGEGGYFPTATSLIGDLFAPNERGRAIALHGVCTTVGGAVGFALGGLLGSRWGWRAPFFLSFGPSLLLALVIWRRFQEPPRGAFAAAVPGEAPAPSKPRPYLQVITRPSVLLMAAAACAASFSVNGLNTFLPLYLARERGVAVDDAGLLTGLFFALALVGQLSGGEVSDRLALGRPGVRPLLVALPYLAAAPAAALIPIAHPLTLALVCYGLTQMARGFAEPNIYGTIIDAVPPYERGAAQGFLLMLTFAGASAAPWLAGLMIKHHGYPAAIRLLAAGAALAGVLAMALHLQLRREAAR
jgi:predicted MFS family arabinose efflux permease